MRKLYLPAALMICGIGVVTWSLAARQTPADPAPGPGGAAPSAAPASDRLVVHEWGTFTGLATSDGVHLPFNVLPGEGLPPFVRNRADFSPWNNRLELALLKWDGALALQRMETPVVYFYADKQRDVSVRVEFPCGTLTEFYPPVANMAPEYGQALGDRGVRTPATQPAGGKTTGGMLDWGTVRILPRAAGSDDRELIPLIRDNNHYAHARETDAALVQFTEATGVRHLEKFLFYRGLGNFTLPVSLRALGGERFELRNAAAEPIRTALLVQIGSAGEPSRFAKYTNIHGTQPMTLPQQTATPSQLGEEIAQALIAEGLYEKEARAMVKTWEASWLKEPGIRVLYMLPRTATDALLPLKVEPAADETTRVLVGRIDVLTPEVESRLQSLVKEASKEQQITDDDARLLTDLGRFRTPALDHAAALSGHAKARDLVNQVVQNLYRKQREMQEKQN